MRSVRISFGILIKRERFVEILIVLDLILSLGRKIMLGEMRNSLWLKLGRLSKNPSLMQEFLVKKSIDILLLLDGEMMWIMCRLGFTVSNLIV